MKKEDLKRSFKKLRIAIGVAIIVFFIGVSLLIDFGYDGKVYISGIGIFLMFVSVLIIGFSIRILITVLENALTLDENKNENKDTNEDQDGSINIK